MKNIHQALEDADWLDQEKDPQQSFIDAVRLGLADSKAGQVIDDEALLETDPVIRVLCEAPIDDQYLSELSAQGIQEALQDAENCKLISSEQIWTELEDRP